MDPSSGLPSDDTIDFGELFVRLKRGIWITLGLTLLGAALATFLSVIAARRQTTATTIRVSFGFPGFERGIYPDGSKFQADDVRAPDLVHEAINRLGIPTLPADVASRVRGSIAINGFTPVTVVKERDRLRAAGQALPPYFPDEYEITLLLPRDYPLDNRQRELLLSHLVQTYLARFRRSYTEVPKEFGDAFASLANADYVEYELILNKEIQSLILLLNEQIEHARSYRSPTNNLSFHDLLKQAELFDQIRLNDVLSLIYVNGLSKDRKYALVKMDYHLRTMEDEERRLLEEAAVVSNLLKQTGERGQNYVLATKAQSSSGSQPMLDQTFIDQLLRNDAYNFLVRKALDAELALKRTQTEMAQFKQRRERMESFIKGEAYDQAALLSQVNQSLAKLETDYRELMARVRTTFSDYARQEYADAVRITMQPATDSAFSTIILGAILGAGIGLCLGAGFSLLNLTRNTSAVAAE